MFFSLFLKDLGLSELQLGYVFSSETLITSIFILVGGKLADIIGRKKTIVSGSIIFSTGPLIMSLVNTIPLVLLGYFIFFAGAGISSAAVSILVLESSPPKSQGIAYMFVHRALPSLPPAITILIGGYLYDHGLFPISLLLAALSFLIIAIINLLLLQETLPINKNNSKNNPDHTHTKSKSKSKIKIKNKNENKEKNKKLLLDKRLSLIIILFGPYIAISNGLSWYIPIYLRSLGHSATEYSYLISLSTIAISIGSLIFGKLIDTFGPIKMTAVLWSVISASCYAFSFQSPLIILISLYSIWAFFSTGISPVPSILIKNSFPQNERTYALATYRALIRASSILGPTIIALSSLYGPDKPFLLLSTVSLLSIPLLKFISNQYSHMKYQ